MRYGYTIYEMWIYGLRDMDIRFMRYGYTIYEMWKYGL